jgi:hypothetical protein
MRENLLGMRRTIKTGTTSKICLFKFSSSNWISLQSEAAQCREIMHLALSREMLLVVFLWYCCLSGLVSHTSHDAIFLLFTLQLYFYMFNLIIRTWWFCELWTRKGDLCYSPRNSHKKSQGKTRSSVFSIQEHSEFQSDTLSHGTDLSSESYLEDTLIVTRQEQGTVQLTDF